MQLSSRRQQIPHCLLVHRHGGGVEEIHDGLHRIPLHTFQWVFIQPRLHVVAGVHETLEVGRIDRQHQLVGKDSGLIAAQDDVAEFTSVPQLVDLLDGLVSMVYGGVVHRLLHAHGLSLSSPPLTERTNYRNNNISVSLPSRILQKKKKFLPLRNNIIYLHLFHSNDRKRKIFLFLNPHFLNPFN